MKSHIGISKITLGMGLLCLAVAGCGSSGAKPAASPVPLGEVAPLLGPTFCP